MKPRHYFPAVLLVAGLLAGAGCNIIPPVQPDSTHYYVLTAAGAKPAAPATMATHARIALRPVEVPAFLRGKPMQVRVAVNEVVFADDARWAESLESGLGRVLRESLEARGEALHVVPSLGEDHDFELAVRVLRCEGDREAKLARFTAVVEIYSTGAGAERVARDTFVMEVPGWDLSYGQLAQKLSEAADGLGDRAVTLLGTVEKH